MFDISFIELLVIFVVALVVLGPDKLPGAVRTAALWIGRAKRSLSKVKAEIEQQINADDIRRQLHNESILADIEKARKNADNVLKDTQKELNKTRDDINRAVNETPQPPLPVVTSSAEEGAPTGTDAWPAKADSRTVNDAPASADGTDADRKSDTVSEPDADNGTSKPPVQDIYNTPPTGRVTVTGRKFAPVQDSQPAPDTSDKKD